MFGSEGFAGHESVHHFHDEASGLKAIIAIHSSARGPGAGGTRMWNYSDGDAALTDVLRLSEGMSYKNAVADLDLGGGKAVVWGDSRRDKTPELFEALGRAIESLGGRYWTAEDVGISPADLEHVQKHTRYAAGLDHGEAASGDPSPHTAKGVYLGMKAAAKRVFGSESLSGVKIAVQGVGSVGGALARRLADEGAILTLTDVHRANLEQISEQTGARIVSPEDIYDVDADIFSPNALGAVINKETIDRFQCRLIAGGANNQFADSAVGQALVERNILYAPDFVINGGGIINVASEISGVYDLDWVNGKLLKLAETLGEILDMSLARKTDPAKEALRVAREKLARN